MPGTVPRTTCHSSDLGPGNASNCSYFLQYCIAAAALQYRYCRFFMSNNYRTFYTKHNIFVYRYGLSPIPTTGTVPTKYPKILLYPDGSRVSYSVTMKELRATVSDRARSVLGRVRHRASSCFLHLTPTIYYRMNISPVYSVPDPMTGVCNRLQTKTEYRGERRLIMSHSDIPLFRQY
jgi:hypothetical protein